MDKLMHFLSGGFLKGYRTHLIALSVFLGALTPWFVGDVSLVDALRTNWEAIAVALGLETAAAHQA